MKKRIEILIILAITLFSAVAFAASPISTQLIVRRDMYTNEHIEGSFGAQFRMIHDPSGLYIGAGYSAPNMEWSGQKTVLFQVYSASVGMMHRWKFDKTSLGIYGQVGYYHPEIDLKAGNVCNEGLADYVTSQIPSSENMTWRYYRYDMDNGIGGEVGATLSYQIFKNCTIGLSAAYRMLELRQSVFRSPKPYFGNESQTHWEFYQDINFGGPSIGASVRIAF